MILGPSTKDNGEIYNSPIKDTTMTDQIKFLSRILPPIKEASVGELQPCYYLVGIGADKIPHPVPFIYLKDVPTLCQDRLAGMNTYIAPASFRDSTFGRKAVNALEVKCLYVDLDVGKPQNSYSTLQDAFTSLQQFIAQTGLSPTIIVHSGVGLQAYWTLTRAIPAATWKQLAGFFGAVCQAQGLIIDPSCKNDLARVLRLPGTLHLKSGNIARVLADNGKDWEPRELWETIKKFIPADTQVTAPAPLAPPISAMQMAAAQTMPKMPLTAKAEPIVKGCNCILTAGLASEPQWFHMMSVMRSCVDGHEWAHKLSSMDKQRYVPADTDAKFYRAQENQPARCSTFETVAPELCVKCPHRGKLTSPIQLGLPAVQPAQVVEPAPEQPVSQEHLIIPDKFNYPMQAINSRKFLVDERGCVHRMWEKAEDGSWSYTDEIITPAKIYYSHSVYTTEDNAPRRTHWFIVETVKGREMVPFVIDRDMTAQHIARWFMEANAFFTSMGIKTTLLMDFMNAYLQSVLAGSTEIRTLKKFGWTRFPDPVLKEAVEGFAVGAGVITETGIHHTQYEGVAARIAKEELSHKGDLEQWKHIPRMYKTLDQKAAQLAICMSFAAPLMRYAPGIATSSVFSLWSRESGKGKTQVMRACASIWGDPDKQFIQRHSSQVLRQRKLSTIVNLPCYMDEMTDVKDEDMYSLAYTLVDGREKQKLKSSGAEMVETGDWQTVTFVTANKSFKEAAARHAGDSNASVLRVMEYECDFQSYEHIPEVHQYIQACINSCSHHYGLAGPEFIFQLLKHRDRLATLTSRVDAWAQKHGFSNRERYMSAGLGLCLIAGRWAVEWGLLDYDMDALEEWAVTAFLGHNRDSTEANTVRHPQKLRDYLMDRQLNTVTVLAHERPADVTPVSNERGAPDKYIISYPPREAYVRVELDEGDIYVSLTDLAKWCLRQGISEKVLLRELSQAGIIWERSWQNIAAGIAWANLPVTQTIRFKAVDVENYRLKESEND